MARPFVLPGSRRRDLGLTLSPEVIASIEQLAEGQNMSRSRMAERLIEMGLTQVRRSRRVS